MACKDKDNPNRIILYNLGNGKRIEIHKPDEPTLRNLYHQEKLSLQEIADKYTTTATSVWRWLKEHGIARRKFSDARKIALQKGRVRNISADIRRLYCQEGLSLQEIADRHGTTPQSVFRWFKKYGIARRNRSAARQVALQKGKVKNLSSYTVDENFFDEWSPEMAWVLGIVITDGCVYTGSGHSNVLKIDQKNPEILYKVRKLMKSNRKIYRDTNIYGSVSTPIHTLRFERKRIVSALSKLGITPRKSLTVRFPDVSKTYVRHFLRGIFDGDGTIDRYSVRFNTGSRTFALSLKKIINSVLNDLIDFPNNPCNFHSTKGRNEYVVYVSQGKACCAFHSFLYKDVPSNMYYSVKKKAFDKLIERKRSKLMA
jgi:predicted DNA-binding protein YlxM (UPF0122 family)